MIPQYQGGLYYIAYLLLLNIITILYRDMLLFTSLSVLLLVSVAMATAPGPPYMMTTSPSHTKGTAQLLGLFTFD
jgi:hypothetical protein